MVWLRGYRTDNGVETCEVLQRGFGRETRLKTG